MVGALEHCAAQVVNQDMQDLAILQEGQDKHALALSAR
jgi:hypothetical protein